MENLFSYGTLQLESVQRETFNRILTGRRDAIVGFRLSHIEITDEHVLAASGQKFHPILHATGNTSDTVEGTVFQVTGDELHHADAYEVTDYKRVSAPLKSGGVAWVYVAR